MDAVKKYNYMEGVLHKIHKHYITLPNKEVRRNNGVLKEILEKIIKKMKQKDELFELLFNEIFYGGSFYDDLKVGKPDEFDLDLLLRLPDAVDASVVISNKPGFVHVRLNGFEKLKGTSARVQQWRKLSKLVDENNYLTTASVSSWMQSVIDTVMDDFKDPNDNNTYIFKTGSGIFKGTIHKEGPAHTLKLKKWGTVPGKPVEISIDLVPCFKFEKNQWPPSPFRNYSAFNKTSFFIVPKKPKELNDNEHVDRYWRLSFQMQERELLKNRYRLKSTARLLKKLQMNLDQGVVASYYIKTMFMWETWENGNNVWGRSQSYAFVTMLKKYKEYIEKNTIPYFWNDKNELLKANDVTLENLANRLQRIINAIESHPHQPNIIAEYLLTKEELAEFQSNNFIVL